MKPALDPLLRLRLCLGAVLALGWTGNAGTLSGHLRDQNWYASYSGNPFGVGYYEYGINANSGNPTATGGRAATGIYGEFQMNNQPEGTYTVASWDVWWRSAYAFNQVISSATPNRVADLRLHATMWGYPAFWDTTGYYEFGQTFVASGPISMIYLRCPFDTSYILTVHENGPGGRQIGVSRSFRGGDQRPIYGWGDMPAVAGQTYYVRVRTSSAAVGGVIMQMDPRPDYSDPMPGGCLWVGNGTIQTPVADRDLGLVIMSDDDGLITDLFTRKGGRSLNAVSVGQTFVARGAGLISAAVWLGDPAAPVYQVRIRENGPQGDFVGSAKRGQPARVTADEEMIVTWNPGECPLVPGRTYFLEVTRADRGVINVAQANPNNPYPFGDAYQNGQIIAGTDLAGTLMEEESSGSAAQPGVRILSPPAVSETDRGTNQVTIRWRTDVPSDGIVEWNMQNPPYRLKQAQAGLVTSHAVTLRGLRSHTLHHFRVRSSAPGYRPAISRDHVIVTRPSTPNLLVNPGFEEGIVTGEAARPVQGWTAIHPEASRGLDMKEANGQWFWGLRPHSGQWLFQGAVNGNTSSGVIYQRVPVEAGKDYTFSAWVTTGHRENNQWKYDVWQDQGRLSYVRLGIDPAGGTNPQSSSVQWTPRFYSHRTYVSVAKEARARGNFITVFVSMRGDGGDWHLYGVDDGVLAESTLLPPHLMEPKWVLPDAVEFKLFGQTGVVHRVEYAEGWNAWQSLTNTVLLQDTLVIRDTAPPAGVSRFYRASAP